LDFDAFADWALANGWVPGLTIDRIENDGNYEPSNCQFLTRSENCSKTTTTEAKMASNKRNAVLGGMKFAQKIRCVETGEVFDSGTLADAHVGSHSGSCLRAANLGQVCKGFRWEFVDPELASAVQIKLAAKVPHPDAKIKKPIRCVETGEIFKSVNLAAKSVGATQGGKLGRAAANGKPYRSHHWEYVG
jgi:hypothetical protein